MSLVLSGTDGLSDVDGTAAAPAIRGTDANTGIFFPAADTIAFSEGGAEAMRIDSSGNVGIGTNSPTTKLQVTGAIHATGSGSFPSTGVGLEIVPASDGGTNYIQAYSRTGSAWQNLEISSAQTVFGTSGTERMRIDSSGNLLVGTTSTVDSAKFVVQDAEGNDFAVGRLNGGNRFVGSSSIYNKTTANAANVFVNSSSFAYAIVRSTSSIKYKKDVENAVHGLAEVLQLRPVTYRGKEDGEQVFGGLIAEEVHELGLTEFVQYDENNQPDALAYGPLVSLAFKAIQEQQALITALTTRITALEAA